MQSRFISVLALGFTIASFTALSAFGQPIKITADSPEPDDEFGHTVSVSGDTAIVGAPFRGDRGGGSGAAYIYERNLNGANSWGQVIKLLADDGDTGDEFGISVSIDGDWAVVGARRDDIPDNDRGSAYVYTRNQGGNGNWGLADKLVANDPGFRDFFGDAVAISGDWIVIGAPEDDDIENQSGSAYIFGRDQGEITWSQITKINVPQDDVNGGDLFGESVAISGDWIVVGATGQDGQQGNSGAAYVFGRNQGGTNNWGFVAKLIANDGETADRFGASVAISGDTVIVGADENDGQGSNASGSAYIFQRNVGGPDNWGFVQKLNATPIQGGENFGGAVAISGDQAVVGASFNGNNEVGTAYVFARNDGGPDNWGQTDQLLANDGGDFDEFGNAVSVSGNTALIGSFLNDFSDDIRDNGAAYIFQLQGPPANEILIDNFDS